MSAENFAEWQRRQGHQVICTQSSYWYNIYPGIYQAFPYHKLINPSKEEISNFFKYTHAIAARYSVPLEQPEGHLSYHVVYNQAHYELNDLPKKARHDVARGLEYASYEMIPFTRLANEGWNLRRDTLIRHGRKNAESKRIWETLCLSANSLPGIEAWGAWHEGTLVASLLACTIEDTVSICYQQSLTAHLKYGVNNALTYTYTRDVLNRPGINSVFYGLHSLDAPASVDEYKFRMRYTAKAVRQRVIFNPWMKPFVQPISLFVLHALSKIIPGVAEFPKAEGLVRFYLQGKLPITQQDCPPVLKDNITSTFPKLVE